MASSSSLTQSNRRRTLSTSELQKPDDEKMKKSLSSTSGDLGYDADRFRTQRADHFDSLDDLNKEIESLTFESRADGVRFPCSMERTESDFYSRNLISIPGNVLLPESDDNFPESSPEDEKPLFRFISADCKPSCDVVIPKKKPVISSEGSSRYQPCSNTIIQLKQSSFSAFRNLPDSKNKSQNQKIAEVSNDDECDEKASDTDVISSHLISTPNVEALE